MNVEIKLLDSKAKVPEYKSVMAAGVDLVACVDQPITLYSGADPTLISTGIAVSVRDPNVVGLIYPRSSTGIKGLILTNGTPVIDSDYNSLIYLSLRLRTGAPPLTIEPGERICQLVFTNISRANFEVVKEFSEETERGAGGFGSTGRF